MPKSYEGEQRKTEKKTAWGSLKYDEIIQTSLSDRKHASSVYSVGVKSARN